MDAKDDFLKDCHDGFVTGIQIEGQGSILIFLETKNGGKFCATAEGVKHFRCDNFLEGNIILDVEFFSEEAPDEELIRHMLAFKEGENIDYIKRCVKGVISGEFSFMYISPSYGCNLAIYCKNIAIEEV